MRRSSIDGQASIDARATRPAAATPRRSPPRARPSSHGAPLHSTSLAVLALAVLLAAPSALRPAEAETLRGGVGGTEPPGALSPSITSLRTARVDVVPSDVMRAGGASDRGALPGVHRVVGGLLGLRPGRDHASAEPPGRDLPHRPLPHGEHVPPARGVLAQSLLLGELRAELRSGDMDVATEGTGAGAASVAPDETIRAAIVADDGLRASLARADAAALAVHAARGAMLPKVSLEAEYGSRDPYGEWGEAAYRTASAVLTIPVFASGANLASMRAARAARDAAAYAHLVEERRTVLDGATAHLDLHAAMRVEAALAENARGMVSTLSAARALFEGGEASLADVAVAEANLEAARGELATARQALARANVEYRTRTGRPAPSRLVVPDTDRLVPDDVEEAVGAAMGGPDVAAGFARADAARHSARAELGAAGPRVDLTASFGHRTDAIEEPDGVWNGAVGVRLTMPLVDFETIPGVRASRARARAAEWDARDGAREVERRVRLAHATHAGAVAREAAAARRSAAMQRALEATRVEYAAGFRTVTDVVRAQIGLARARIDRANVERDRHRSAYTLAVLMGRSL